MPSSADPFEGHLSALFAQPPEAPDAEAFALTLERRIAAESKRRRLVFGACAAAAGLAAAGIVAGSGAFRGLARAAEAVAGQDFAWVNQAGPAAGAILLVLIIAEFSSSASRR